MKTNDEKVIKAFGFEPEYKIASTFIPCILAFEVKEDGTPVDEYGDELYERSLDFGENCFQRTVGKPHFMVFSNVMFDDAEKEYGNSFWETGEEFVTYAEAIECIRRHQHFDKEMAELIEKGIDKENLFPVCDADDCDEKMRTVRFLEKTL